MAASTTEAPLISVEEVERVARLAHLDLSSEETQRLQHDLAAILGHVRELESLDLTGVEPTELGGVARTSGSPAWLRADDPGISLRRDVVLREAPRVAMAGFAVPAFVDES